MIGLSNKKLIEGAAYHLKRASHFLRMAEHGNKPFRISKAINIMGKTTYDDYLVLKLILREITFEDMDFEMHTHAVKLLLAELEDNPTLLTDIPSNNGKDVGGSGC